MTLPLVDALFTDETFQNEAMSALQLSDEEIQKIKDIARDAVLSLDEKGGDETRSTAAATKEAERQIKQALGEEKGTRFLAFVRTRGAESGVDPLVSAKPNSVPTDTRIVVNAPAYRMDIFKDGQLVKSYKIGIGYPEFPLPTGLRKATTIIFNPTWTPPDEPWVKGKFRAGKTVEAGSKDNPLGPIKVPIGLPSLIHGGKAPSRLGTFASHGCVGLTSPQVKDFALELSSLTGPQITKAQMESYLSDEGETKEIKLDSPIPVELRYETIVVEDGKLRIFRDVYERGTNTEENLRRTLEAAGVSFDDIDPGGRDSILKALREMAQDATGRSVDGPANAGEAKKANATGKVTQNIKGKKEIVFELPMLKGKGYPAPVNLSTQ